MSNAPSRLISALLVAALVGGPLAALADGKRDLEDGIAFYENLDTERAIERLRSAARADDLGAPDRARAFMYLGIVLYETGKERDAEVGWQSAFQLHGKVAIPAGTSPKIVQAIEKARASAGRAPKPSATPAPSPTPSPSTPPISTPDRPRVSPEPSPSPPPLTSPYVDSTPPIDAAPVLVEPAPPPPEDDDEGGVPGWLIWTGIGAAVIGGSVAAILIATSGPSCERGACLLVDLQ